jgi:hypothetical protein
MSKATPENNSDGGPAVLRFEARLEPQPEAVNKAVPAVLRIPPALGRQLAGLTKVEGTINGHPFRAALESNTSGGHLLRVSKAMRAGAGASPGDTVTLAILGPEPEPIVPADLGVALGASREAMALWQDLSPLGQRDWIRWIEAARKPQTRERRVSRTVEQLAEGKRRPCCVNVNEYMLCRVREGEQAK